MTSSPVCSGWPWQEQHLVLTLAAPLGETPSGLASFVPPAQTLSSEGLIFLTSGRFSFHPSSPRPEPAPGLFPEKPWEMGCPCPWSQVELASLGTVGNEWRKVKRVPWSPPVLWDLHIALTWQSEHPLHPCDCWDSTVTGRRWPHQRCQNIPWSVTDTQQL